MELNGRFEDMTGRRFGRLVILKEMKNSHVLCRCDCGKEIILHKENVKDGNTSSCGCLNRDRSSETMAGTSKAGLNPVYIGRLEKPVSVTRNTSGIRGVSYDKSRGKWAAEITINRKKIHLGRYEKKEDAAKARKKAEEKYFQPLIDQFKEAQHGAKDGRRPTGET